MLNANDRTVPAPEPLPAPQPRLRLWPALVIILLQSLGILVPAWLAPVTMAHFFGWVLSPIIGAAGLVIWWLFASRAPWKDRWFGLLAFAVTGLAAWLLSDSTVGLMGMVVYALPTVTTAWVLGLAATLSLSWPVRRVGLVVVFLITWGVYDFIRSDGADGNINADLRFRWSPTAEQRFLADLAAGKLGSAGGAEPRRSAGETLALQPGDWAGFRGPNRDSRLTGVRIATDWQQRPPRLVWRHRVGPGWSSFAVVGNRLYTQEQRGEDEVVVCYDAQTGVEIWTHRDTARFTEMMAGPGPRATPTFHSGRLYAQGATGVLNCLDAATGRIKWSRNIATDAGAKVPQWGFASSPLVTQGIVTVFAGGPDGKSVLGYNAELGGEPMWARGEGQLSYGSLQPVRIDGIEQLLIATDQGVSAFHPTKGDVLWHHAWPLPGEMARVVQPALIGEADVFFGAGFGIGSRRFHVKHESNAWTTDEVWTTRAIKPYFNDLVIHQGHLYGFDGAIFTCVNLDDGKAKWKERGYGNGQVLLLADQNLLLILSEKGEVALVEATPDGRNELVRFQAIEGKTWNHPVIAHGKLFVRNGEEAACYELTVEGGVAAGEK